MEPNNTTPQSPFEKPASNHHATALIVIATLLVVAGVIGWSVWSIIKTGGIDRTVQVESEEERERRLAEERQAALIEQQAADMERIREERGLTAPTEKELKEQAAAMEKLRTQKKITAPTQAELDQQAAEMEALRAAMGQ